MISVGLYGFRNVDDFMMAYEKLKDSAYPIKKMYLSNVISYLIGYSQRVFHCVPVTKHEDWGSIETWNMLQRQYAVCIIDADRMIGRLLSESCLSDLINLLSTTNKGHMQYILMTAGIMDSAMVKKEMIQNGINCVGVITEVSQSNKKIIISSADELRLATLGV